MRLSSAIVTGGCLWAKGTAARLCGSAVLASVSVEQQAASGAEAGFPAIPLGADPRERFHHPGTGRLAAGCTARASLTTFWIFGADSPALEQRFRRSRVPPLGTRWPEPLAA